MVDGEGVVEVVAKETSLLQGAQRKSGQTLASADVSFNGCPVVLNTGHWDTKVSIVENHTAQTGTFDYADETSYTSVCCDGDGRYFIEGCEAALDTAGEWSYAADTPNRLLFVAPDKQDPATLNVHGKVQTYAMSFYNNSNVELRGIRFFATTIIMFRTQNSKVANCIFEYPSYSRRALNETASNHKSLKDQAITPHFHDISEFDNSGVILKGGTAPPTWFGDKWTYQTNNVIENNEFLYTDGVALYFRACGNDTIENNFFHHIGVSAAGEYGAVNCGSALNQVVRRNTFDTTGGSETIVFGGKKYSDTWMYGGHTAELNYFTNGGRVQSDGAAIHAYKTGQNGTTYQYNWAVNNTRGGFRFDAAEDGFFGKNGTMQHNVAFNNKYYGLQVKGFQHTIVHNTAIEHNYMDICFSRCYPSSCANSDGSANSSFYNNNDSILEYNVGKISSKTIAYSSPDFGNIANNLDMGVSNATVSVSSLFVSAFTGDWRPRASQPLLESAGGVIGAYMGTEVLEYWIPGRKTLAPSMPVPFDGSTDVPVDASLMFLTGSSAASHEVWLARQGETLTQVAILSDSSNIFDLQDVEPGASYNWQVVAVDTAGLKTTSQTWSFSTMQHTTAAFYPSGDTYVYRWTASETKLSRAATSSSDKQWLRVFKEGSDGKPVRMSFLKFDVALPAELQALESKGYQVKATSASLQVHVKQTTVSEAKLWAVSDTSWDANTLSYQNMPSRGDSAIASLPEGEEFSAGSAATFQLSTMPSLDGSLAFAITTNMTSPCCTIGFYSSETDYPPKLQLSIEVTRSSGSSSLASLKHVRETGHKRAVVRKVVSDQRPAAPKSRVRTVRKTSSLNATVEIDSEGTVSHGMHNSPH